MRKVKLTKEQQILFDVYEKGVQNEDCDLDFYLKKLQAETLSELERHKKLHQGMLDVQQELETVKAERDELKAKLAESDLTQPKEGE